MFKAKHHELRAELSHRRAALTGFLILMVLVLLTGFYSLAVLGTLERQARLETLSADQAQALLAARLVGDHQHAMLDRIKAIASRNSFRKALLQEQWDELRNFLSPLAESQREVARVFLADARGRQIMDLRKPEAPLRRLPNLPSGRARPWVSTVEQGMVTVSAPVLTSQGDLTGFLGLCQRASYWGELLDLVSARPGRTFFLYDQNGNLVDHGPDRPTQGPPLAALAREGRQGQVGRGQPLARLAQDGDGNRAFVASAPIPGMDWVLVVAHDYDAAMAPTRTLFFNIGIFLAILVACLLFMGFLLYARYRSQQKTLGYLDSEARRLESMVAERTDDLRRSTQRYQSLVAGLPDIIFEMDAQGVLTFVSDAVGPILGYDPQEVLGRPYTHWLVEEDQERFRREQYWTGPGREMRIEALRHVSHQGRVHWLSLHAQQVTVDQGREAHWRGVAREVTMRVLAEQRVRELSGMLIGAQEEERKRIALDLHDEMGQMLSALKLGLQTLSSNLEPQKQGQVERLVHLTQNVVNHIRALAYHLRPAILDNFGLTAALNDLCDTFNESHLLTVAAHIEPVDQDRLSPEQSITMYRFVQESLTNVIRHARSPRAEVSLTLKNGLLEARVSDAGRGFDVEQALGSGRHLGLFGMKERLRLLGGNLEITSSAQGTTLVAGIAMGDRA